MTQPEQILAKVNGIHALPGTVLRLINVVNDPSSTVDDIVDAIKYDQAVTSQMLRVCNSAFFSLSREIASINDAMRYLGTVKVLQLVMAVHSNTLLAKQQTGYGLAPGILWKHSVAVALASAAFGQKMNMPNTAPVFTAGLLHDVGKVILNEHVADEFAEIIRRVTEHNISFVEAEKQVLGFSHDEIGARVAEKWQLPEPIIRCIRYHHAPGELNSPDNLVDIVYLANTVCMLLGIGLGSDGLCYRADEMVMERNHLKESDLETVGAIVMADLKQVEQLFRDTSASPRNAVHREAGVR